MTSPALRIAALAVLLLLPGQPSGVLPLPAIGQTLGPWTPGTLEIHQISTGRGNAAFSIFPNGATLLVDAGDAGPSPYADPMPDGTRTPAEWIVRYVRRMMAGRTANIDYAVVTHYHPDHLGRITGSEPQAPGGAYLQSGITHVGTVLTIGTLIDRGRAYLQPAASDRMYANYKAFAAAIAPKTRVETARPGRTDQIADRAGPSKTTFSVRVVSVNDRVWTGAGETTTTRFPALETLATEDLPTENMCSVTLRIALGAFDYFTGGDMPGYPVPGAPAWHDLETAVAKAMGPTDVHVVNHHGSIEEENPFFLATLRSRVMIVPAHAATHPSPDVLKRMLSKRVYPDPRDIFIVQYREPTKAATGPRAAQVASDHGHVVIRVDPDGSRYQVIVLDDANESYLVRSVHGPYLAR